VRFEVLKAMRIKNDVFWDVAACSLVDSDRYFRPYGATSQDIDLFIPEIIQVAQGYRNFSDAPLHNRKGKLFLCLNTLL
jgi:hypothetical protein